MALELEESGVELVSVDEKTGIQALERAAETKPMRVGEVEKQESEYIRHGTQCLIGNFKIATGEMIAPSIGGTRTRGRFCEAHQTDARNQSGSYLDIHSRPAKHAQIRGFGEISGE